MRKKRVHKKYHTQDIRYDRVDIGRFINYMMRDGEKALAEKAVYGAFEKLKKDATQDPVHIFEKAIENASPQIEVRSRRIGGANYQIPQEVRPDRKFILASRWIIAAARARRGKPIADKLAAELLDASKNEGAAIKKKQDTHRMAEANRAFAHFAR
ncbi:MAG: 30S ribosomal protein S7 [Candidatus Liptonbacteria bacterium]|nr:30S ribosomal protein S7 [Candidatus Liptonbacteria bacterium]